MSAGRRAPRAADPLRRPPDGYPGNDDLGTLSAWYVFGALGLYPAVPGVGMLAIGSPLFGRARIALPHGRHATIVANASSAERPPNQRRGPGTAQRRSVAVSPSAAPYVQSLLFDGHAYARPWLMYCALARGARLSFELGRARTGVGRDTARGAAFLRAATEDAEGRLRALSRSALLRIWN